MTTGLSWCEARVDTDQEDEVEYDKESADAGSLAGGSTDTIKPNSITKRV